MEWVPILGALIFFTGLGVVAWDAIRHANRSSPKQAHVGEQVKCDLVARGGVPVFTPLMSDLCRTDAPVRHPVATLLEALLHLFAHIKPTLDSNSFAMPTPAKTARLLQFTS
jgi:hypothetical protein